MNQKVGGSNPSRHAVIKSGFVKPSPVFFMLSSLISPDYTRFSSNRSTRKATDSCAFMTVCDRNCLKCQSGTDIGWFANGLFHFVTVLLDRPAPRFILSWKRQRQTAWILQNTSATCWPSCRSALHRIARCRSTACCPGLMDYTISATCNVVYWSLTVKRSSKVFMAPLYDAPDVSQQISWLFKWKSVGKK